MKKLLLVAAIALMSSSAMATIVGGVDVDAAAAGAVVGTVASGSVTGGYNSWSGTQSGSTVNTTSQAHADADLYREPHSSAGGTSFTQGYAWGSNLSSPNAGGSYNSGYFGASGAGALDGNAYFGIGNFPL